MDVLIVAQLKASDHVITSTPIDVLRGAKIKNQLRKMMKKIVKILSLPQKTNTAKTTAVMSKYCHRGRGRGYGKPGALSRSSSPLDIASDTDKDSRDDSGHESAESPVSTTGKSSGQGTEGSVSSFPEPGFGHPACSSVSAGLSPSDAGLSCVTSPCSSPELQKAPLDVDPSTKDSPSPDKSVGVRTKPAKKKVSSSLIFFAGKNLVTIYRVFFNFCRKIFAYFFKSKSLSAVLGLLCCCFKSDNNLISTSLFF